MVRTLQFTAVQGKANDQAPQSRMPNLQNTFLYSKRHFLTPQCTPVKFTSCMYKHLIVSIDPFSSDSATRRYLRRDTLCGGCSAARDNGCHCNFTQTSAIYIHLAWLALTRSWCICVIAGCHDTHHDQHTMKQQNPRTSCTDESMHICHGHVHADADVHNAMTHHDTLMISQNPRTSCTDESTHICRGHVHEDADLHRAIICLSCRSPRTLASRCHPFRCMHIDHRPIPGCTYGTRVRKR